MFMTDNQTGAVTQSFTYDAFGNPYDTGGTPITNSLNPYLATGEYFDFKTNLYNHRARMYSPVLGQFLSRDSYERGMTDLHNIPYGYNNPLNFRDPSGHMSVLEPLLVQREQNRLQMMAGLAAIMEGYAY